MKLDNVKKAFYTALVPGLTLILITAIIILNINRYYPYMASDYRVHVPRLLDTYLHYRINGLSIQWYTPSLGGGLPSYPNPQQLQFSLPELFMFVINPWWSLMLSLFIYSAIGFTSFYLLLKNELHLLEHASILGATFILANGFYVEHAIAGHIGYQQFPLLGTILYLMFSKKPGWLAKSVLFGIIGTLIINQAGFFLVILFSLSLIILLPLLYMFKPEIFNWKNIVQVLIVGALFTLLLSASKLNAVYSFMRFFPRLLEDVYGKRYLQGLLGVALQLMGGFWIIPYYLLTGKSLNQINLLFDKVTGSHYGIWETDIALSPALLFLLVAGLIKLVFLVKEKRLNFSRNNLIAGIILLFGIWLTMDFTLAHGRLYQLLKPLPLISSIHVNVRFASVFIFPLSFLGAYLFDLFYRSKGTASLIPFLILNSVAIFSLLIYLLVGQAAHERDYNLSQSLSVYAQIGHGNNFPVKEIVNVKDDEVFLKNGSNLFKLNEVLFGYDLKYFKPKVHYGSVFEMKDGYYNMTNPASYVFPAENHLQPFEPFRTDQLTELESFVNRRQPNFQISSSQKTADVISLGAVLGLLLYILLQAGLFLRKVSIKQRSKQ